MFPMDVMIVIFIPVTLILLWIILAIAGIGEGLFTILMFGVIATMFGVIATLIYFFPLHEEFYGNQETKIYSIADNYNSIYGSFFLGTGYINSKEQYAGNIFDGTSYERIYIPVLGTKIQVNKNLKDYAIYKIPMCIYKNTDLVIIENPEPFRCKDRKGILQIPESSIIQKLNFQ